jgi:hypothetical protein
MAQILFTDKLKGSVLSHQDVNEIKQTVNINGANSITTVKNVGDDPAGHGVFKEKPDGNTVSLKNMVAGTGMTVGSTDNDVVFTITNTEVVAADYKFPKFTVNQQGQITAASSNEQDIRDLFSVEIGNAVDDGNFTYNNSTGVLKYFPTATRSRVSVAAGSGLTYDVDTGVFDTLNIPNSQLKNSSFVINSFRVNLGGTLTLVTDNIAESLGSNGLSNATNQWFTQPRVWNSITLNNLDAAGNGSLTYNAGNGNFYFKPTKDSWVRSLFSVGASGEAGDGLKYDNTTGVFTLTASTTQIEEGTRKYFTTDRARNSVSAGNGLTYDKSTGVFTTNKTDSVQYSTITASSKVVTDNIEAKGTATTVNVNDSLNVTQNLVVGGNLTVNGSTTTVKTEVVKIDDNILTLNSNVTGDSTTPTENAGIEVSRGKEETVQFTWDETADVWTTNSQELRASRFRGPVTGNVTGQVSDVSNHNTNAISEGSTNLYYTDTRARESISVTDSGGDGSLAYNDTTGVITYTGPSAAETQAHFSVGDDAAASGGGGLSYTNGVFTFTPADVGTGARGSISVTDSGGDGSLAYNDTTGVITYTGPSAAETQAHFSVGGGISYTSGTFTLTGTTDEVPEASSNPTNLYFTNTRARGAISLSTAGTASGNGSLAYDNSTGAFTFTPADVAAGAKSAISLSTAGTASGNGSLSYSDGAFTFTPADVAAGAKSAISLSTAGTASGNGSLSYSDGAFTFTPADVASGAKSAISLGTPGTASGGGSLSYADGVFTFTPADPKGAIGYTGTNLNSDLSTITTGLQGQINGKADSTHTHTIGNVSGLQTALDAKLENITSEELQELGNVAITNPINNQVLAYDQGLGLWTNQFASGSTALSACSACDLTDSADVNITDVQTGDTIQWNGTRWVNVDMISLTDLKAQVAASTNFADFQAKIAAL